MNRGVLQQVDAPQVVIDGTLDPAADSELLPEVTGGAQTSFVARLNPRTSVQRGQPITLQVDNAGCTSSVATAAMLSD